MKRGEVWTASGGMNYAGKPRPVVILQDDRFSTTASVTVCPLTSDPTDAPLMRLPVEPTPANGLRTRSRLMVDKITTMSRQQIGRRLGRLGDDDVIRLNRAVFVLLGAAG